MVTIEERETAISEGPQEITLENVRFWCKHTKELKSTQAKKAMHFVENDCIKYVGDDAEFSSKYTFVCLPLNSEEVWMLKGEDGQIREFHKKAFAIDYNSSDYKIYKNAAKKFECNCQGWQTREARGEGGLDGCSCSHVLALMFCFKLKKFGGDHNAQ
ncbi:MAG: hypothetical protein WC900_04545 [Oscillospiraceae bacterium]|jgi:hypothetical protein